MSDLIDRQAAIDGKICIQRANGVEIYDDYAVPVEYLKQLPSAQPKRGRWVLVCDNNGMHFICNKCGAWRYHQEQNFCGECGADMRGERNE